MEKIYDKLVRDKIPEICEKNGDKPTIKILSDTEYINYLKLKFYEEVQEVVLSGKDDVVFELADLLEVMTSYAKCFNISLEDIIASMKEKREKRGGFSKKILLIKTDRRDD